MNAIRKVCESDANGTVHVEVPVQRPRQQIEVVLVWQAVVPARPDDWPPGWFESTAGILTDPTFEWPVQGDYERRHELD